MLYELVKLMDSSIYNQQAMCISVHLVQIGLKCGCEAVQTSF